MKTSKISKKMPILAIFLSVSLILGYIEFLIPLNIGQFGIKLGISNIITLLCLKYIGIKESFTINILRILILGILFGNFVRFLLSLAGFLFSFVVMIFAYYKLKFSIITCSIFGGANHNIGQVIMISIILRNPKVLFLLPVYIIIGIVTGTIIGVICDIIINKINKLKIE